MMKHKKIIAVLSLTLLLGGCGSKSSTKTVSTASQNTSSKTQGASSTAKSSGDKTSSTKAGTDKTSEQGSTSTSSSTVQSSEGQALLKSLYEKSKTGNIPNCNFNSNGTLLQTVEKTWGKADKTDVEGKDTYYIYDKYGVVFGVRKDSKIFNIRLYGKNFDEIRYDDVEETLGKPSQVSNYKGETTVTYNVNKDFQFMLIFYEPKDNNPNPVLQYISVTCSKVV